MYSTYFVGTTAGAVYQVFVSDNKMKSEDCTKSILRYKIPVYLTKAHSPHCKYMLYTNEVSMLINYAMLKSFALYMCRDIRVSADDRVVAIVEEEPGSLQTRKDFKVHV